MKVECAYEEIAIENDSGILIDSIELQCSRCDHITKSFGTSNRSIKRCLALLAEECALGEDNFYIVED